jgi:hypothetical protein
MELDTFALVAAVAAVAAVEFFEIQVQGRPLKEL